MANKLLLYQNDWEFIRDFTIKIFLIITVSFSNVLFFIEYIDIREGFKRNKYYYICYNFKDLTGKL